MPPAIVAERPDTPDAMLLIDELQTHLESLSAREPAWVQRRATDQGRRGLLRVAG